MVNFRHFYSYLILILLAFGYSYEPSAERGDPNYRRTTNIDVNQVRSTIYNWGYTGKTAVYTGYGEFW